MTDTELADELIRRLNDLLKDPSVRSNLTQLLEQRIVCSGELAAHPTIQTNESALGTHSVGFLGILNGLVGVIPDGPKKSWGYITCVLDDAGWITEFRRTA